MKLPTALKFSLFFMVLLLAGFGAFVAKSYYNQNKSTETEQPLSVKNHQFEWKIDYSGNKFLMMTGYLINDSEYYFDQIFRSFEAEVKFKNGHKKTFKDKIKTINKDQVKFYSILFNIDLKTKSFFTKYDQVLKPGEQIFFKLGNTMEKMVLIRKNELIYPIEYIKFKLIAEARTPLNEVWRGELIACEVPLQ